MNYRKLISLVVGSTLICLGMEFLEVPVPFRAWDFIEHVVGLFMILFAMDIGNWVASRILGERGKS